MLGLELGCGLFWGGFFKHKGLRVGYIYGCINTRETGELCAVFLFHSPLSFIAVWRFVDMFGLFVSRLLYGMLFVSNSSMPFASIMLALAIVPINQA